MKFSPLTIGLQYQALDDGQIDTADVFTTDGQLQGGKYVVLKDPKHVFGFQNVTPVVEREGARPPRARRSSRHSTRSARS